MSRCRDVELSSLRHQLQVTSGEVTRFKHLLSVGAAETAAALSSSVIPHQNQTLNSSSSSQVMRDAEAEKVKVMDERVMRHEMERVERVQLLRRQVADLQAKVDRSAVQRQKVERSLIDKSAKLSTALSDLQLSKDLAHALQTERSQVKVIMERVYEAIKQFDESTDNHGNRQYNNSGHFESVSIPQPIVQCSTLLRVKNLCFS